MVKPETAVKAAAEKLQKTNPVADVDAAVKALDDAQKRLNEVGVIDLDPKLNSTRNKLKASDRAFDQLDKFISALKKLPKAEDPKAASRYMVERMQNIRKPIMEDGKVARELAAACGKTAVKLADDEAKSQVMQLKTSLEDVTKNCVKFNNACLGVFQAIKLLQTTKP